MATYTYRTIYDGTLTATSTAVYTATASMVAKELIVANHNTSAVAAYVKIGNTQLWPLKSASANQGYPIPLNTFIASGDAITAYASATTSIDIKISGFEIG